MRRATALGILATGAALAGGCVGPGEERGDLLDARIRRDHGPAPEARGRYVVLAKGDTLFALARREYQVEAREELTARVDRIVAVNALDDPGALGIGMRVFLPAPDASVRPPAPNARADAPAPGSGP